MTENKPKNDKVEPEKDLKYYMKHPDELPKYLFAQPLDVCKPLFRVREKDGSIRKLGKKSDNVKLTRRRVMRKEAEDSRKAHISKDDNLCYRKVPIPVVEIECKKP